MERKNWAKLRKKGIKRVNLVKKIKIEFSILDKFIEEKIKEIDETTKEYEKMESEYKLIAKENIKLKSFINKTPDSDNLINLNHRIEYEVNKKLRI